jgi:CRP-like cAMP-binding protein
VRVQVFPLLKPISAGPREIVYAKGAQPDGLYFLLKGSVEVISGYDGRVLYRVRQGQFFGETVLTGRRRVATHRAASSCEMYIVSADDLGELFRRRPDEGKLIYAAVLREYLRKQRLRNLSLRLLLNKLENTSPMHVAALRLQMAYSKHMDRVYGNSSPLVDNFDLDKTMKKSGVALAKTLAPTASLFSDPSSQDATTVLPGNGGSMMSTSVLERRLEKLDRIDSLFTKVEVLEKILERMNTGPRSGGRIRNQSST